MDITENIRREMVAEINASPNVRESLELQYGKDDVFNTSELTEKFEVHSFMAPFVVVRRKSDGKIGTLTFQHSPRFYFNFVEDGRG